MNHFFFRVAKENGLKIDIQAHTTIGIQNGLLIRSPLVEFKSEGRYRALQQYQISRVFRWGVTSGIYDNILDTNLSSSYNLSFVTAHGGTTAGAEAFLFNSISLDESYFNIHTTVVDSGEIRSFLTQVSGQVPEPTTLALLSFGLVGLGWSRLKKV